MIKKWKNRMTKKYICVVIRAKDIKYVIFMKYKCK